MATAGGRTIGAKGGCLLSSLRAWAGTSACGAFQATSMATFSGRVSARAPTAVPPIVWSTVRHLAAQPQRSAAYVYHLTPLSDDEVEADAPPSGAVTQRTLGDTGAAPLWRYLVEVVTGSVRGAGTPNLATIQLFGTAGASARYRIGDEGDNAGGQGFARDSRKTYAFEAPHLGALRRVYVAKDRSLGSELGAGWFLEHVTVTAPGGGTVTFPCHSWVAEYVRNLLPCVKPVSRPELAAHPVPVSVRAAGLAIPDPAKLRRGVRGENRLGFGTAGEDAYFYTSGASGMFGLGVADGVHAWRKRGIDAGLFSRTLVETAAHLVDAGYSDVLRIAQVCSRKVESEGIYGSSTLCLGVVDRKWGRVTTACLGDSALMLLGVAPDQPELHVKFRTAPQEHEFGWPYQLGHHAEADRPEECVLASLRVTHGDVLIVGSDGLWDNLFDREVAAAVRDHLAAAAASGRPPNPAALSRELVGAAYERGGERRAFTPYSYAASEWFDAVYDGGKPDDIALVVAFIE